MERSQSVDRGISIRVKIALVAGIFAVIIWSILAGFSYRATGVLLQVASQEMFHAATNSVNSAILETYQPVERTTSLLAFSQLADPYNDTHKLSHLPLLTRMLTGLPTATAIQVGVENGDYFIVRKLNTPDLLKRFFAPDNAVWMADHIVGATRAHSRWAFDKELNLISQQTLPPTDYDPRTRPWYTEAMTAPSTITTNPYVFFFMEKMGVTVARKNEAGNAVIATDIILETIAQSLQDNRITPSAESAMVGDDGVIVWSGDSSSLIQDESTLRTRTLSELSDPVFNQLAKGVTPDGWLVHRTRLMLTPDIEPELIIVVPKSELLSELNDERDKLLIGSLIMLALLIPVAWALASRISIPLRSLHAAISDVSEGNIDFWLPPITSRDEVGDLNLAMRTMRTSLKQHIDDLAVASAARERIESELNVARKIQMSLVPGAGELIMPLENAELYVKLLPARAVGGDLYDVSKLENGQYFITVGDVSDKGIPAALFMSRTITLGKVLIPKVTSLSELLAELNEELIEGNDECMFITLFCGIYDPVSGRLRYACAGHNPPILVTSEGSRMIDMDAGSPLGLFSGNEYTESQLTLLDGERLVIYTDGITEAFDVSRNEFSDERLLKLLREYGVSGTAQDAGEMILKEVFDFAGEAEQSDDITLLVLDRVVAEIDDEPKINAVVELHNEQLPVSHSLEFLKQFAQENQIPSVILDDLMVVVDEVVSNIVKYAQAQKEKITFTLEIKEQVLTLTFADHGTPFNPLMQETPDIDVPVEERDIGGLGILLVTAMTDKQDYQRISEQNVLILSRNISV